MDADTSDTDSYEDELIGCLCIVRAQTLHPECTLIFIYPCTCFQFESAAAYCSSNQSEVQHIAIQSAETIFGAPNWYLSKKTQNDWLSNHHFVDAQEYMKLWDFTHRVFALVADCTALQVLHVCPQHPLDNRRHTAHATDDDAIASLRYNCLRTSLLHKPCLHTLHLDLRMNATSASIKLVRQLLETVQLLPYLQELYIAGASIALAQLVVQCMSNRNTRRSRLYLSFEVDSDHMGFWDLKTVEGRRVQQQDLLEYSRVWSRTCEINLGAREPVSLQDVEIGYAWGPELVRQFDLSVAIANDLSNREIEEYCAQLNILNSKLRMFASRVNPDVLSLIRATLLFDLRATVLDISKQRQADRVEDILS
jgi:hypothetical protein